MQSNTVEKSPLKAKSEYIEHYQPNLLFSIPRLEKRQEIGIHDQLPFSGVDYWNAFEISWLNPQGKPQIAVAEIIVPCESTHIFESKSLKLYLNSFSQTTFDNISEVKQTISNDLSQATHTTITVNLFHPDQLSQQQFSNFSGSCLDDLPISTDCYQTNPDFLTTSDNFVEEKCYSHLLKSNCLVTKQPDWGSVFIHYHGPQISAAGLLKYIISFRQHTEFHEQCVERMFQDIMSRCKPERLTVYARYTRRGGCDINPFRSNFEKPYLNLRIARQ